MPLLITGKFCIVFLPVLVELFCWKRCWMDFVFIKHFANIIPTKMSDQFRVDNLSKNVVEEPSGCNVVQQSQYCSTAGQKF